MADESLQESREDVSKATARRGDRAGDAGHHGPYALALPPVNYKLFACESLASTRRKRSA